MSPTSTLAPPSTTWKIDPHHSHVEFAVRHLMISTVKGHFTDVQGVVTLDGDDPSANAVEVTIAVASINTRQEQRDAHLRSPDFFDAENFPSITFRSRQIVGNPLEGDVILKGDLTIRGVTREVTLNVTNEGRGKDPWGNERAGFSADRKSVV